MEGKAGEWEELFFDAMHGSTVKGASNAEPQLRRETGIASMEKLGIAYESSFSASKNNSSHSPAPADPLHFRRFFCFNFHIYKKYRS